MGTTIGRLPSSGDSGGSRLAEDLEGVDGFSTPHDRLPIKVNHRARPAQTRPERQRGGRRQRDSQVGLDFGRHCCTSNASSDASHAVGGRGFPKWGEFACYGGSGDRRSNRHLLRPAGCPDSKCCQSILPCVSPISSKRPAAVGAIRCYCDCAALLPHSSGSRPDAVARPVLNCDHHRSNRGPGVLGLARRRPSRPRWPGRADGTRRRPRPSRPL